MTIHEPAPMPQVPASLHGAPVESEPILETLAWQIASDLWPHVERVEVSRSADRAQVVAHHARMINCIDLYFDDDDRLVASTGGETINDPDRSIARDMLARLRGGR